MSFELTTIGHFAKVQGGFAYKSSDFTESGLFPVLKIKNVRSGFVEYEDLAYISKEVADQTKNWETAKGDILISMTGSGPNAPASLVGRVAKVWLNDPKAFINQRVGRLRLLENVKIDKDFLFYVLSSSESQQYLVANATGSANQANISASTIESVPCPLVDFNTSKKIAEILGCLDSRIRLMRETNATLEAIAQALFKSWFVDFDPVHAHARAQNQNSNLQAAQPNPAPHAAEANAQNLGLDAASAALFPDHFQDSDLGPIPAGWSVSTVGEAVNVTDYVANGSFASLKENVTLLDDPAYALYVRTTDYNSGFSGGFRYVDQHAYEFLSKSCLEGDEVIISNVGDVGTVFRPPRWLGMRMTLGSNAVALKAPQMSYYLYLYFSGAKGQHDIASIVTGSAQLKFNKTNFRSLKILIPSQEVLKSFESISSGIFSSWDMNRAKIQTLAQLRDTLLPRLISGQLRLPDAEAQIEAVVGGA